MTAIKNTGARSGYITHIIRAHTSLMLNLTATNKSRTDLHTRHTVLSRTNCSSAPSRLTYTYRGIRPIRYYYIPGARCRVYIL